MDRDNILEQLKPRFSQHGEWLQFLAFVQSQRIRGDAEEIWLQWDIHLLQRQSAHLPWHNQDQRFLPASAMLPAQPIL